MLKKLLVYLFIFCLPAISSAQKKIVFDKQLYILEDSLKNLGKRIINHPEELERKNATYTFIRTLVQALKLPNSFQFPFDSVQSISIQNAEDDKFRIFTWHLVNGDGTYRYYGALQVNNPDRLELYPFSDRTDDIAHPEDTVVKNDFWYGALYYRIIKKKHKRTTYYTLLGWKGNNIRTTKKVIDVLTFRDGKPYFGAPIFDYKGQMKHRVVFEFTSQASMLLRYLDKKKWIIYDHIAPPNAAATGIYETYGPDMSHDALKFKRKKWILKEDVVLENEKTEMDNFKSDRKDEKLFENSPVR